MVHIICELCDVMLGMCDVHGAHAIIKIAMSKYSNSLTGMPADLNLMKLTASHFKALITENANENLQS